MSDSKKLEVLFSNEEIEDKISIMAERLTEKYKGKNPVFIVILKGAFVFASHLLLKLDFPLNIEFMVISSYGNKKESSGTVRIEEDIYEDIRGRHVIILEDIVDTGLTLKHLTAKLWANEPKSLEIATLLDKPSRRKADVQPDYTCFEIDDYFVVGFGLDYAQFYRNLPYVGILLED